MNLFFAKVLKHCVFKYYLKLVILILHETFKLLSILEEKTSSNLNLNHISSITFNFNSQSLIHLDRFFLFLKIELKTYFAL